MIMICRFLRRHLKSLGFFFWLHKKARHDPSSLNEKHVAGVQNSGVFQRGRCGHLFLVCTAEILELGEGQQGADKGLFFLKALRWWGTMKGVVLGEQGVFNRCGTDRLDCSLFLQQPHSNTSAPCL